MFVLRLGAAVLSIALGVTATFAQGPQLGPVTLSEVRGGVNITGVELWTFFQPYAGREQYRTLDTVEAELLFTLPNDTLLKYLGNPALEVGGHLSTVGRASMAHIGLTWGTSLFDTPFFLEGTVGGAITNSTLADTAPPNRAVGCPLLFYFSADVGYRIDEHWSVMGSAYHASHAALCNLFVPDAKNVGLNGFGVKVGYKF